jgi:DNA-binding NarL/FixJ family response regulator
MARARIAGMHPTHERAPGLPGRPDRPGGLRRTGASPCPPPAARIAVASDLALVAETVGAALRSHGVQATLVPWALDSGADEWPVDLDAAPGRSSEEGPDLVVLICGLDSPAEVDAVRDRGGRCIAPWLVMADREPGPAWGAVLEVGARAVVSSSISLSDLVDVVGAVLRGESPIGVAERIGLLRQWWAARADREQLRDRMRTLSPREQTVLAMLYEGTTVRAIADRLEVSEATVRSQVKAVLRKLSVASQLAAVAAVGELREEDRPGR